MRKNNYYIVSENRNQINGNYSNEHFNSNLIQRK